MGTDPPEVELTIMESKVKMRRSAVLLALTAAVVAASVLVAERFSLRLDLSSDRANTLSKVSRELYKEIPEQVRITYYISSTLSSKHPGPRAIEDFLRGLESASRGRIVVETVDPASGKGETAAQSLGVSPQRMQVVEKNESRVALVYSGIVAQYLDRTQVLPFVISTDTLEYDLVKAVRAAVADKKPKAAVLLGDSDKSLDQNYQNLSKALEQSGWEKEELSAGQAIPPDAGVLLVLGNSALDDYDVYRIDAYLAGGGRALFAVKGVDVVATQGLFAKKLEKEALLGALEAYGAKVGRELVLDKSSLTLPFQSASPYGGAVINYVRYPHWIMTRPENRDGKSALTARLAGLDLFWPSPIELLARQGVESQSLVKTSPEAWLQKKDFAVSPQESALYATDADATKGQYVLAATLSGILPQAFAGKAVPARKGAEALPALPERSRASRILVVGSSDFATDYMSITESEFNAAFIVGAADWLSSGDDLLALKTRGQRDSRFSKVQDPDAKSALATLAYVVNIGLVPLAVLGFGLARAGRRRRLEREEAAARGSAGAAASAAVATADASADPAAKEGE
jgi:ABC-type uncharacterized transport system involved in gliding motility auxiliary subunit